MCCGCAWAYVGGVGYLVCVLVLRLVGLLVCSFA